MKIPTIRAWLYWWAKALGDYRAVKTGRVARRIGYRLTGKLTGRALGRLWR